jgi:hypothetical protein
LLLLSCTDGDGKDNPDVTNPDLYKGTEGLEMVLISELPEVVYEDEPFQYVLKLTNKGVYPINGAVLTINVEEEYLSIDGRSSIQDSISLDEKVVFQDIDDFEIRTYDIDAGRLDDTSQSHETIILVNACYDYMLKAFADVCIDSDPHDIKPEPGKKECDVKNIDMSDGQGGPVIISGIEPKTLVDDTSIRPQFKITIKNVGGGSVVEHGRTGTICSSGDIAREEYNKISVGEISMSDFGRSDFDCAPEPLRLQSNEDTITCTMKSGRISKDRSNFLTPLYIKMNYGYLISSSNTLKIEKILTT